MAAESSNGRRRTDPFLKAILTGLNFNHPQVAIEPGLLFKALFNVTRAGIFDFAGKPPLGYADGIIGLWRRAIKRIAAITVAPDDKNGTRLGGTAPFDRAETPVSEGTAQEC
jgi:hypothetical protein